MVPLAPLIAPDLTPATRRHDASADLAEASFRKASLATTILIRTRYRISKGPVDGRKHSNIIHVAARKRRGSREAVLCRRKRACAVDLFGSLHIRSPGPSGGRVEGCV